MHHPPEVPPSGPHTTIAMRLLRLTTALYLPTISTITKDYYDSKTCPTSLLLSSLSNICSALNRASSKSPSVSPK